MGALIDLPRRQRRLGRGALGVGAIVAVVAVSGTAYAYWTTSGGGSGSGSLGTVTIQTEALATGDAVNGTLYPGGSADAILRLKNPNAFSVHVTDIAATGAAVAANNCSPTGVSFTAPSSYTASQFTIAAGASTLLRLNNAVLMTTASASACQGQTFSLPVTVTVQK